MAMQESAGNTRAAKDLEFAMTKASAKQQREKDLVKEQLATLKKIDDLTEQYQVRWMFRILTCCLLSLVPHIDPFNSSLSREKVR